MRKSHQRRTIAALAATAAAAIVLSGCSGAGGGGDDSDSGGTVKLNIATVSVPQMKDMESLADEFEKSHPNIKLHFTQMEESDLRDALTKDVATQSGQYDVVTVGSYETPIWGKNGWLTDLGPLAKKDSSYDVDDFLTPIRNLLTVDGHLYAAPFYGESSFLMYNKEIFAQAGITMPEHPTWEQVAQYAKQLKTSDRAGICLRGKPGWGEVLAPLTTVVNTFGGQWFDMDWNAGVDSPEFAKATKFYIDLVKDAGEADPVSVGFTECLNLFSQGKAAMWYDATSAAGTLEDPKSSGVAGKVGYVHAPVEKTKESGWLFSWNLAIPKTTKHKDAAWEFVKWGTSKKYANLVGSKLGWSRVTPGSRQSTYENPHYKKAAHAFADITKEVINAVNPKHPGVKPQPYIGVQYVTIPQFQELGNNFSQDLADVFAGRATLDSVLKKGQQMAQKAGDEQKKSK